MEGLGLSVKGDSYSPLSENRVEERESVTETGRARSCLGPDIVSGSKRSESEDSWQSEGG